MSQSTIVDKYETEEITRLRAENSIKEAQLKEKDLRIADLETSLQYACQNQVSGLPGHLVLNLFLEEIKNQPEADNFPITALVIDLKKFKDINDKYGHEVGDKALKHAGKHFREVIRLGDKIFHLPGKKEVFHPHGDEYVILFTKSRPDTAHIVSRRIGFLPPMIHEGEVIEIKCDIGIETASSTEELKSLLHNADKKMYMSKKAR